VQNIIAVRLKASSHEISHGKLTQGHKISFPSHFSDYDMRALLHITIILIFFTLDGLQSSECIHDFF
jgi:hypothetical protein